MIVLDLRNIIISLSLAVHISLLWILFRYGRKTPGGAAYSLAVLAIAGWILPMIFYRANLFGQAVLWVRLLYIMASFTSVTFLFFTLVFPESKKKYSLLQIFLLLENLVIIYLLIHPTYIIRGVEFVPGHESIILWGPLYFIFATHISLFFLSGFVILFRKLHYYTGNQRRQIILILSGYFLGSNLAMMTNLILPWIGYFELNWSGQIFSTILAIFTTYAILKYQLLSIKILITESLLIILNLFILSNVFLSISLIDFLISAVVFCLVLFLSYLLLNGVRKEVERREEMQKLAGEVEHANQTLVTLDKAKSEFLSIVAHQLRTPLTVIGGYISLLREGAYGKTTAKVEEVFSAIDQNNKKLNQLVDEFLDITRLEEQRLQYVARPLDIRKVIDTVVERLVDIAKTKRVKIIVSLPDEPVMISGDEEKLNHIFDHLIDNAIKYGEAQDVHIKMVVDGEGVLVKVKDGGIGIKEADLPNLFQKFYRTDNAKMVDANGVGLGLFLCKKFVEAHNGWVGVESLGVNKGSTFNVWLPLKR